MFDQPLVSSVWLAEHHREVRIVDVRWYLDGRSGAAAYATSHVPGAVFVDLDTDLAGPPSAAGGRHPLPTPDHFATVMRRLGIDDDTPVVAYDDAGGAIAARLWWMLHVLGHQVAVLDGGIDGWSADLGTNQPKVPAGTFTERPWPGERFRSADQVASGDYDVLIDSRTADRYTGANTSIDPRPGHVPGAHNAPFPENLSDGALRRPETLATRFVDLGVEDGAAVVAYCGSGVTACHNLLALELAGLGSHSALFVGSSSAWAGNPDRPLTTGPNPT